VFVLCLALMVVIAHILRNRTRWQRVALLDAIADDSGRLEDLKTVNDYVNHTIEGFRVGHPVCMDWSILRWAIEKWPDRPTPWFIYAKFICIFPEQSSTLSWIYGTVVTNKVKSSAIRTVKMQSLSIAGQREAGLGAYLKEALRKFATLLRMTKQKLRRA
jgi:hypothetical protein